MEANEYKEYFEDKKITVMGQGSYRLGPIQASLLENPRFSTYAFGRLLSDTENYRFPTLSRLSQIIS